MNYYQILEISTTATQEEIKKAFRTQAKKYHPDINPDENAAEMMIQINLAYETLSDVTKRKEYDQKIKVQNKQAYQSYQSSREENEKDLEPWLKEYLLRRRHLDHLYNEYARVEATNIRLAKNYIQPSKADLLKEKLLLEELIKTLRSFINEETGNPILIFEFLLGELENPADSIATAQRKHYPVEPEYTIILDLILVEIKLFLKKFTDPEHPDYLLMLKHILKKYIRLSDRITYMKREYLIVPAAAELIESILLEVIEKNKTQVATILEEFKKKNKTPRKSYNVTNW